MNFSRLGLALLLAVGVTACDAPLQPETPPLLKGASIGQEHFFPCPPDGSFDWEVLASPEFEVRVRALVPSGSSEQVLMKALAAQGFRADSSPCKNDTAIRSASFIQSGGGLSSYPIAATAFWRVGGDDKIEWIRGTVAFAGP